MSTVEERMGSEAGSEGGREGSGEGRGGCDHQLRGLIPVQSYAT